jgi:hydrogenase nickel incorporation protein HypA/HybF
MHEASLAQSIVEAVLAHAKNENAETVKTVEVDLGRLSSFSEEQVAFWVKIGFEKTIAEKAKVRFRIVEPVIKCSDCGFEGPLPMPEAMDHFLPRFACPSCGGAAIEITKGREVVIRRIRIVKS